MIGEAAANGTCPVPPRPQPGTGPTLELPSEEDLDRVFSVLERFMLDSRLTADVNGLVLAIQLARSEAFKRGQPVVVCKTLDQIRCAGRGVGLVVVKTGIEKLNGRIDIESEVGSGTVFRISLPLTLAILPVLVVKHGAQPFAVPLAMVHEILSLEDSQGEPVFHDAYFTGQR